jgi:hypothetical protein
MTVVNGGLDQHCLNLSAGTSNGDYLLKFYGSGDRDRAIEFAVLAATKRAESDPEPLDALDLVATKSQCVENSGETF